LFEELELNKNKLLPLPESANLIVRRQRAGPDLKVKKDAAMICYSDPEEGYE
jgi:hypothetical protein